MTRRQSIPKRWLVVNQDLSQALKSIRHLPRRSGVLLLIRPKPFEVRVLARVAAVRDLTIIAEAPSTAARVHRVHELTQASLRRTPLILISPIYATRSHPDWEPLPRMRAAALARLADRRAIALGGMDEKRFRRLQRLGFVAWAGISGWRKVTKVTE